MCKPCVAILSAAILLSPATAFARPALDSPGVLTPQHCTPTAGIPDQIPGMQVCEQVVHAGDLMTLIATAPSGSLCLAGVWYYDTHIDGHGHHAPLTPNGEAGQLVGAGGSVSWQWRNTTNAPFGPNVQAVVSCGPLGADGTDGRAVWFLMPGNAPSIDAAAGDAAAATPAAGRGSAFTAVVSVGPASMPYNAHPYVQVHTRIGSTCAARVIYDNGYTPNSFDGYAQRVGKMGVARWYWHEETKSGGGTATVTCTHKGQTAVGSASFTVS